MADPPGDSIVSGYIFTLEEETRVISYVLHS
jgi:hypothetical protein